MLFSLGLGPTLFMFLLASGGSSLEIRPSFSLDYCSWHATDVVLVTEGEAIDGRFLVLDVWAGSMERGQALELTELARFADTALRTEFRWSEREKRVTVSGSRMVLFLKREGSGFDGASRVAKAGERCAVSTLWIEGSKLYGLLQTVNPGPSVMSELSVPNEEEAKKRVEALVRARSQLAAAAKKADAAERARDIERLLLVLPWEGKRQAFEVLANCGPGATPVILRLLAAPEHATIKTDLYHVLAKAAGPESVPFLLDVLKRETDVFSREASRLSAGWWNGEGIEPSEVQTLRDHYSRLYQALRALDGLADARSRESVQALRDLWVKNPHYDDRSGLDQMTKLCDTLLARLPH